MSNVLRFLAGALGLATLVAFLQQSGAQPGLAQTPAASPTPVFSIDLIAHAELDSLPSGEILITVSEVVIPAGVATRPISAEHGPVIMRVNRGSLILDATAATITTVVPPIGPLLPEALPPGPVADRTLTPSDQVVFPQGATGHIENPGPDRAVVALISITSLAPSTPGTPGATPVT